MLLRKELIPRGNRKHEKCYSRSGRILFFFFLLKSVTTSFLSSPCICYFELHRFINTYQYANGPSDMNSFSVLMLRKYGVCVMRLSSWHKQTPAVIYLIF